MGFRKRLFLSVLFASGVCAGNSKLEARDPIIFGGAFGGSYGWGPPFASPPGWFGPGPAGLRYPGVGPGPGWSYTGLGGGPFVGYPWWFGVPGAAGSFWTNGLSLYGPPVPTYGPVPGAFGGGDAGKHFFRNPPPANGVFFGLGWPGYRSPSPRPRIPTVNVWPNPDALHETSIFQSLPPPASDPTCLRIAVKLPAEDATVWIDNKETTLKGHERVFESPPLDGDGTYAYDLIAQWTEDGQSKAASRKVKGKAGEMVIVDFTREELLLPIPAQLAQ